MAREFDVERAQREVTRVLQKNAEDELHYQVPHIVQVLEGMGSHDSSTRDLIRSVGTLLGDRWTTLMVHVLRDGPFRYAVLHRLIGAVSDLDAISQRMLSLRLRALEREGFVERVFSQEHPPRVEYGLTPLGVAFSVQAGIFSSWVIEHMAEIRSARDAFDSSEEARPDEDDVK